MTSQTTEQALEACIEKALTGTCKEERGEGVIGEEERGPVYGPYAGPKTKQRTVARIVAQCGGLPS